MATKRRTESANYNMPKHYSVCDAVDATRIDTSRLSLPREPIGTFPIWRSLSTIHAAAGIPSTIMSVDVNSPTGLQIIRPETHPEAFVPVPPDGGWGWFVVFAAFTTNLIIDGICVSFGIMANEFVDHFEASVAIVMLTGSLMVGCYQIVGPIAAGLVNKFGCRVVGMSGSLLATIAMFASAFMPTIGLMLFSYGIVAGIAFGLLHLPTIICVSFYFDSKRALAIGLTVTGTPVGAMIFAPLTEVLLNRYGWSNTLILFSGILLNCAALAALYRPLVPAILLRPLTNTADMEIVKSMLQMADAEHSQTRPTDLHDQPIVEEEEGEGEATVGAMMDSTQPVFSTEKKTKQEKEDGKEAEESKSPPVDTKISTAVTPIQANGEDEKRKESNEDDLEKGVGANLEGYDTKDRELDENKPFRRHSTVLRQIIDPFLQWRTRIRAKRQQGNKEHILGEEENDFTDEKESSSDEDEESRSGDEKGWSSDPGISSGGEEKVVLKQEHQKFQSVGTIGGKRGAEKSPTKPFILMDDEEAKEATDQLRPLVSTKYKRLRTTTVSSGIQSMPPPEIVITRHSGRRTRLEDDVGGWSWKRNRGALASQDCILSTPNLGLGKSGARAEDWLSQKRGIRLRKSTTGAGPSSRLSEWASNQYSNPIPRTSVVHLAHFIPQRSIALRPRTSSVGDSQFFAMHQSNASGIGELGADKDKDKESESPRLFSSVTEQDQATPVIVELPHESITIEDYARPMYRKDIFFPGSVKRQMPLENALTSMGSTQDFINSKISIDEVRKRKISFNASGPGVSGAQFGSSILFGENVPLPLNMGTVLTDEDANWTGSCLMSLTKIPLPDVFKSSDEDQELSAMLEQLKQETGLYFTDTPADGIYRVPRSETLCGWWLCWKTRRISERISQEVVKAKDGGDELMQLWNIGQEMKVIKRKKGHRRRSAKLVLQRTCRFMPKSIWDVVVTMMDFSLLKDKSLTIILLASLIATMGVYVPLFFVCDLAESYGIPKSQSSFLLTIYGGASTVSRLLFAWAAGKPNTSPLVLTLAMMMVCGIIVCLFPFLGNLWSQIILMAVYGFSISPYFSLISTVLCDILNLEALTSAYGLVTMVRGVASTVGSPIAGMIVTATGSYDVAFISAGGTILIGGLLYVVVTVIQRAKYNKSNGEA